MDKDGVVVHDEFDNVVNKEIDTITWTPEMAEKEGYDHFMIKEINEQATAVRNTLTQKENIQEIIDDIDDIIKSSIDYFLICIASGVLIAQIKEIVRYVSFKLTKLTIRNTIASCLIIFLICAI